jgi:uncharacterized protein
VREQVKANRKAYCTDNGLVTAASFRFSQDHGKLYENLVAIALRRLEMQGKLQLFSWKGQRHEEVDFVVKEGLRVTRLIQVCRSMDDPRTREREVRALLKASQELDCRNLLVLTENTEGEGRVSWFGARGKVRFVPLWKWLAGEAN